MTRSLLFLSYLFPPRGGAGVQRALKFVKYLPQFGWRPLVVANGGVAQDNVITREDPTLLKDLPREAVVRYTRVTPREQRYYDRLQHEWRARLTVTDRMGWWVEPAVRQGMEMLREHDASAIFVTMSPFTAAEAGIRLKEKTGLPLILDLRDPWALDETHIYPTRWHAWRDMAAMKRAFAAADLVLVNTPEMAAAAGSIPLRSGARMVVLTNGYDVEDFQVGSSQAVPAAPRDVLRIVHTGQFHSSLAEVWDKLQARHGVVDWLKHARRPLNNWSRTPRYLLQAMHALVQSGRMKAQSIEMVLVGNLTDADQRLIERSPGRELVRILGYRNHDESVQWLQSADLVFLPLHSPLDGKPALVVPGKTYEYLGCGRPVLAMGGEGDMRRMVREARAGFELAGDDVDGAADAIFKAGQAKREGIELFQRDASYIRQFERRELTRRLAEELDRAAQPHARAPAETAPNAGAKLAPAAR